MAPNTSSPGRYREAILKIILLLLSKTLFSTRKSTNKFLQTYSALKYKKIIPE